MDRRPRTVRAENETIVVVVPAETQAPVRRLGRGTPVIPLRDKLLLLPKAGLLVLARFWFMQGFKASGAGFNGETADVDRIPGLRSLLVAEFDRLWARRRG